MDSTVSAQPGYAVRPAGPRLTRARAPVAALVLAVAAWVGSGPGGMGMARAAEASPAGTMPAPETETGTVSAAMDRLGWRLVSSLGTEDAGANVLVSPWGLASVMAVLDMGATGTTRGALTEAWTGRAQAAGAVLASMSTLRGQVSGADRGDTETEAEAETDTGAERAFADANGIWIAEPMAVQAPVAEAAEAALGVQVASVDFTDPATVAALNAWATARTDGAIPVLLARADPARQAVVANGLHFAAPWTHPFARAQSHDGTFVTEAGDRLPVTFMRGVLPDLMVERTVRYDRVALPLAGGDVLLRLTRPTDGHTLEQALSDIRAAASGDAPAASPRRVDLTLPRFAVTAGGDLTPALRAAGLGLLFDGSGDFSDLAPGLTRFDSLSQRVRLSVDEAGLEAAALTVASSTRGLPKEADLILAFDRPFLVDLVHEPSGAVLLCGAVHRPGEDAPGDP